MVIIASSDFFRSFYQIVLQLLLILPGLLTISKMMFKILCFKWVGLTYNNIFFFIFEYLTNTAGINVNSCATIFE